MPQINQLSLTSSVSSGDLVPVFSTAAGDARSASMSVILDYIKGNFASPEFETVTAAPSLAGFTVTLDESTKSIWLILSPVATLASGTIVLPDPTECFDGQTVIVTSSSEVTTLTVNGNGGTVSGAPTSLANDGFFALRFYALTSTWYCVSQSLGSIGTLTDPVINGSLMSTDGEVMLAFAQRSAGDAVNYVTVVYNPAGQHVGLEATGDSADIEMRIKPKGAGTLRLEAGTGGVILGGASAAIFATTTDVTIMSDNGDVVLTASAGKIDVQSRMEFATAPRLTVTTVGDLPGTPLSGMLAVVTDATVTTKNSIVAGGGANSVVVFYDGTNWRIA